MQLDIDILMNSLEDIKRGIQKLYRTNTTIRVNGFLPDLNIAFNNSSAVIKTIYPNTFQIEEHRGSSLITHTFQYTDVLLHRIELIESEDEKAGDI